MNLDKLLGTKYGNKETPKPAAPKAKQKPKTKPEKAENDEQD